MSGPQQIFLGTKGGLLPVLVAGIETSDGFLATENFTCDPKDSYTTLEMEIDNSGFVSASPGPASIAANAGVTSCSIQVSNPQGNPRNIPWTVRATNSAGSASISGSVFLSPGG